MADQPFLSIVTPVYNGGRYLAECIESVLAQDYVNWEYLIVDNRSTDDTLAIAERYAAQDSRIRVSTNDRFLPVIENWNNAIRQISPQSRYCKVVHADDLLLEGCIRRMVDAAETDSRIGVVGAYRINGDSVDLDWLPYPQTVFSGREVCRKRFLGAKDIFGSPTSTLVRADLVRSRGDFYDPSVLHADTEVCFDLMQEYDFGFVHHVLTYTRRHEHSVTSKVSLLQTYIGAQFNRLVKYGPSVLNRQEYETQYRKLRRQYRRMLGFHLIRPVLSKEFRAARRQFWEYHREELARVGERIGALEMAIGLTAVVYNKAVSMLMLK